MEIEHIQKTNDNRFYCIKCSSFFNKTDFKFHAEMKCNQPTICFIKKVKIVNGKDFYPKWNSDMQVIETDIGTFIDNIPGKQFGYFRSANRGFDWKAYEGKELSDFKVIYDMDLLWINKQ